MKYTTLAELHAGYERGEISGTGAVLVVDNDDTHVYAGGECVFRMHPQILLEQALDLLGIPHEGA